MGRRYGFLIFAGVAMGMVPARGGEVPPPLNFQGYYQFNSGFTTAPGGALWTTEVILAWSSLDFSPVERNPG